MSASPVDEVTLEIIRSYLVSTVREMIATTTRTAYSTCFAHGEDFTCALFDRAGRMIAQDHGVLVHAAGLGDAIRHIVACVGEIREGDVFVHNDPYHGGTHQADGLICRPVFVGNELYGFAANRGHWTDVGGMSPGGWSGAAVDVMQEGLLVPPVRLMAAGQIVEDVRTLLLSNVRAPSQLWGDIQAQIASNIVAERRISDIVSRYGRDAYFAAVDAAISYSRRRLLTALAKSGRAHAEGEDFIEDDGHGRTRLSIRCQVRKAPDGVVVDFDGTEEQAYAPVNSTLACTKAAAIAAVVAIYDPYIPLNQGVIDLIRVEAPLGSLVNPCYPAPTFGATADPSDRVCETVLEAIRQLEPERVPAGSYATGNNVTGGGLQDGDAFLWYSYQAGGCGAGYGRDGNSAEWHLMANSKNESMEVWESRYPVEFLDYRLVANSGGAGQWRGGIGTERRFRVTQDTWISGISDHHDAGARGAVGGSDGAPNAFFVETDGVRATLQQRFALVSPSKFANVLLRAGDIFVSVQGGGGGYGDPALRDPDAIRLDIEAGYITEEIGQREYGWSPADVPQGDTSEDVPSPRDETLQTGASQNAYEGAP